LKEITVGDFWYTDASRHAMDGVFYSDFIREMPVTNPYGYAVRYFAKYPALGLIHYPPLFGVVEAGFYLILGISPITARLTVVFFALIAVLMWYQLINLIYGREIAFFSSALFITTPFVVFWSREVMLEMPALALIISSVYFFYNYFELNKSSHAYYLALSLAGSILTKQTAVFLIPLFVLYLTVRKKHLQLLKREALISLLLLTCLLIPLAVFTIKFGKVSLDISLGGLGAEVTGYPRWSWANWLYYIRALPAILTLPVLALGFTYPIYVLLNKGAHFKEDLFFILWLITCYVLFSYFSIKEPRYIFFMVPPFCLLATLLISILRLQFKKVEVSAIVLLSLFVFQFTLAYAQDKPYISGYEEAARYVTHHSKGEVIFFDGRHDGNFIFHLRRHDLEKTMLVLRGDKILYAYRTLKAYGVVEYVHTYEEIYNLLSKYRVRYVILEDKNFDNMRAGELLREMVKFSNFMLIKKINIKTNIDKFIGSHLLIFEYRNDHPVRGSENLTINIPSLGKQIILPINSLIKKP
jgi:hypothetical protein